MDAELERILVEDYLDGLAAIGAAELRSRRGECQVVETQLSYLRRLVQGRHDIVTSEIEVNPARQIVWTSDHPLAAGVHHFQILTTNGRPEPGMPQK